SETADPRMATVCERGAVVCRVVRVDRLPGRLPRNLVRCKSPHGAAVEVWLSRDPGSVADRQPFGIHDRLGSAVPDPFGITSASRTCADGEHPGVKHIVADPPSSSPGHTLDPGRAVVRVVRGTEEYGDLSPTHRARCRWLPRRIQRGLA